MNSFMDALQTVDQIGFNNMQILGDVDEVSFVEVNILE